MDWWLEMSATVAGLCVAIIALLIVPMEWRDRVRLDIPRFTEQWYKTLLGLIQLGIGALFLQKLAKRAETRSSRERGSRTVEILQDSLARLDFQLDALELFVMGDTGSTWKPELRGALILEIRIAIACLARLTVETESPWTRDMAILAGVLDDDARESLKTVCTHCERNEVGFGLDDPELRRHLLGAVNAVKTIRHELVAEGSGAAFRSPR
jgi:hypothetical protein